MGFIGAIMQRSASGDSSLRKPAEWMINGFGGPTASSGVRVTAETAKTLAVFWGCLRVISDDMAKLPLRVHRDDGDAKNLVPAHPANRLLNKKPNPKTLAFTFRQTMQMHVMTAGRAFAEIRKTNDGTLLSLHPIHPDRVTVENDQDSLRYRVRNPGTQDSILRADQMLHLRGLGNDGVDGMSVIAYARESLGMGLSAQAFGGHFFARGMRPAGILKTAAKLTETAIGNLRKSMEDLYGGSKNAGKVPIFDNGLEWQNVSIPPEDAQFIETRGMTSLEVCQWLRVPPFKVFDMKGQNNGSLEQQQQSYVTDSMGGWMVMWEQELHDKLLTEAEKADHYFKHNASAMLRGDFKGRSEGYAIGRQNGWMSVNEIRALEDLNPVEGGELYLAPLNMTTLENLGNIAPADPAANNPTPTKGQPGPVVDPPKRSLEAVSTQVEAIVRASQESMTEALRRVLHTEADKATRAIKRGELEAWAAEFYKGHVDAVRAAVFPVVESIIGSVRAAIDPDGWKESVAGAAYRTAVWHVEASRTGLADPAKRAKLGDWTTTRAAADAAHYLEQLAGTLIDEWRRSNASGT